MGPTERIYRAILRLYPREFRERFGQDMAAAFRQARADARARGRVGLASFWAGVAGDAFVRAPGEHMQMLLQDLHLAARTLRKSPVFTLVAVLTLALGIGANTAIFSVVHAVALKPLGYHDPDRLVRIWEKNDKRNIPRFSVSVPNYISWREQSRTFEELGASRSGSVTLTTGGEPQRLTRLETTATMLPLLGVQPILGRGISGDEDRAGGPRVAVMVESIWRSRFGADPSLVGRAITLDGVPHTVVGIVRDDDLPMSAHVLTALAPDPSKESRSNHMMSVAGRLRPGVSLAQAQQEMDAIAARLGQEYPEDDRDWGVATASFYDWLVPSPIRTGLYLLLASVGVVLLIACSNVANLMLARAALRRRELAVRLALGATRVRIVRHVLTESLLLAAMGGVAGLMLARWSVPLLRAQLATAIPRTTEIALSTPVLLFSLGVTLLTGFLFGSLPALFNSRRDLVGSLKEGSRGGAARQQSAARAALVVAQIGLATVLLAAAALLVQSFQRLQHVDLGFRPARLTTAMLGLPISRYPSDGSAWQFYSQLLEQIAAAPGVENVALTSGAPLAGGSTSMPIRAIGANALDTKDVQADWRIVSPAYFETLGIPLLRGRTFAAQGGGDHADLVLILSQDLTRRFWPDSDPIGRQVQLGNKLVCRVAGIVGDVRNIALENAPNPTMYFSAAQVLWPTMTVVARSSADLSLATAIRQKVTALDPQLAVFSVQTMETMLQTSAAQPRLTAWLVGLFAVLALLLASIGVYGVLAYLVAQRTQEIGIRMALGARPSAVVRLVLGHALRLSLAGVTLGVIAALLLGPAMASLLFDVSSRDSPTLAGVAAMLVAIALLASYVPARRATRFDPLIALRSE